MWLLHTSTLSLRRFSSGEVPDYVILSHRWLEDDQELTFNHVLGVYSNSENFPPMRTTTAGYDKVAGACRLAKEYHYDWIWIDCCCIQRANLMELLASYQSMWAYYKNAKICFAYLADVPNSSSVPRTELIGKSSWWSRGWTLPELLAPDRVEFYAQDWSFLGTKHEFSKEIANITSIREEALLPGFDMSKITAAEKFSWAAHRHVTRPEDETFSMLGLLNVDMPIVVDESAASAFFRLQCAIFAASGDCSLFLFRYSHNSGGRPLLADRPARFCPLLKCNPCSERMTTCLPPDFCYSSLIFGPDELTRPNDSLHATATATSQVCWATLQLLNPRAVPDGVLQEVGCTHLAVLNVTPRENPDSVLCLPLQLPGDSTDAFLRLPKIPILLPCDRYFSRACQSRRIAVDTAAANVVEPKPVSFAVHTSVGCVLSWRLIYDTPSTTLGHQCDDHMNVFSVPILATSATSPPVGRLSEVVGLVKLLNTPRQTELAIHLKPRYLL